MLNAVLSQSSQPKWPAISGATSIVAVVLAAWFALVVLVGASGGFVTAPGALLLRR